VPSLSPDGTMFITRDGVYAAATCQPLTNTFSSYTAIEILGYWAITYPAFNRDGTLLVGCTRLNDGSYINNIYGLRDNPWPYRNGNIFADHPVNVREFPSTDSRVVTTIEGSYAVFARTADNSWFKVRPDGYVFWVSASVVDVISMPEEVPVENP